MKSTSKRIQLLRKPLLPLCLILVLFLFRPVIAQVVNTDEKARLQQFEDAITLGEQYLAAKDYARAKAEYQKALTIDPASKYPKDKLTYIRKLYIDPADEARFKQAMESAGRFMESTDYASARNQFEMAVNIKPEDKTAREKLAEADKLNQARQEALNQYKKLIADADKLYQSKDYAGARAVYEKASVTDPEAVYPRQRIGEIDASSAAEKAQKESYEKTLAEGDDAYMNRDFATAKLKYELALKIRPGENYPKSMLERVSQGSAQLKDAQQNYRTAIALADKLYVAGDYETALQAYLNASKILTGETYPAGQIEKINAILLEKQKLEEEYAKTVSAGNQFFELKQYAESRSEFQKANDLKPQETYPKQKIEEIAVILLAIRESERVKAYNKTISEADQLFDLKDYLPALKKYQEASEIKAEENYPRERISTINKINADTRAAREAYENVISKADMKYAEAGYSEAIVLYQSARDLQPDETYPVQQISKAQELIASNLRKEEAYNLAIVSGDRLMESGKPEEAIENYQQALLVKPGSTYPQDQITKANSLLAANKSKEERYLKLIADADKLAGMDDFAEAVKSYTNALELKPQEKYPADQVVRLNGLIDAQKAKQAAYIRFIAEADLFFGVPDYEQARMKYNEALALNPSEKYPQEQIEAIQRILEQRKSLEENFARSVSEGDGFYKDNDFGNALKSYNNAKVLKPAERYPHDQIILIETKIAEQKTINDQYHKIIADADQKYNSSAFEQAIPDYQAAQLLKPAEKYPADQIVKAREEIESIKRKEGSYNQAIASGDQMMGTGRLEEALLSYQNALSIKPESSYPQEQIVKINSGLAANRSKDDQYRQLIADADRLFQEGIFAESVNYYTQALALKPQEKYPTERINELHGLIGARKAKQANYDQQIASADKLLNESDFEKALIKYQEAALTLPSEKYPKEKIASVNKILEQIKSLEENYARNISEGDLAYKSNELENALKLYEQAKSLKPSEKYPQEKIDLISKSLVNLKALNDNYQRIIADADLMFNAGKLDPAAVKYKEARDLKPSESYPQQQIGIINSMISKQKETEETYRLLIAEADRLYSRQDTDNAMVKYLEALALKPSETYPGEQIAMINANKSEIARADQAYAAMISRGDTLYSSGSANEAILVYRQALNMKPSEHYPADRIATIEKEISDKKSLEENYRSTIEEADRHYGSKEYTNALASYQKALSLRPAETHPQERVSEIISILEERKQLADKDYNDAVETANRLFTLQDYTSAIKAYEKASAIKPGEAYPKNKLIEINTILMERVRNQMDAYNKVISKADLAYQDKVFDQAIDAYEEARLIRPEEGYPGEMIRKIRQYMEDHAMVDLISSPLIIKADSEQKFLFRTIEMRLRKNNYIIIKARKTGETEPKVYLNYGIDSQKSGGIVLRSIKSQETGDYMVRVSIQDRWYRLDNNWISIYSEGGEVEVSRMQISQGD
ncbi:MAG: hypothetical protein V1775_00565 [Bacteroidota bacterium]